MCEVLSHLTSYRSNNLLSLLEITHNFVLDQCILRCSAVWTNGRKLHQSSAIVLRFNGILTQEVSSCDDGWVIGWCRRKQNASTGVIFSSSVSFCFSSLFKLVSEYTHLGLKHSLHIMTDLTLPLNESILRLALSISLPSSLEWLDGQSPSSGRGPYTSSKGL